MKKSWVFDYTDGSRFLPVQLSPLMLPVTQRQVLSGSVLPLFCHCGGLAIAIAAHGCGIGQGMAVEGAVEGIARNPEHQAR